jgi:hypothetical protein
MDGISLNARFENFIRWIRPDPDAAADAERQRGEVQSRIKDKAEKDGLMVRATPESGSFAKGTGLRRHMLGDAEHEGQDVDCAFVVNRRDEDGDVLTELLRRFDGYADQSYPTTPRKPTKSSVKLLFVVAKRNFDLVPLLAVEGKPEEQILLRANGERRRTSVQKHVEFVRARTKTCRQLPGRVTFNDGVRLAKWWREYQITRSKILDYVPTFLIDLLCAKAFDEVSVQADYPATLQGWFDKIHSYAFNRTSVTFTDFTAARPELVDAKWKVIDPVNPENNAVPQEWGGIKIDEFRDWARDARDKLQQAIAYDLRGRQAEALALMTDVLGPSFKNHSEP